MMYLQTLPREAICRPGFWRISPNVPITPRPVIEREAREPGLPEGELALFWEALDAIPNDDVGYDVGYDVWLAYCHAAHWATGGSAEGLERFEEWSARSSKHVPGFAEQKVWNYADERRVGGITAATVFAAASAAGWVNPASSTVPDAEEFGLEGAAALRAAESAIDPEVARHVREMAVILDATNAALRPQTGPPVDFPGLPATTPAPLALQARQQPADHEPPAYYRDKQGVVKPTVENAVRALSDEWEVGMQIGHDAFRDEMMVQPAGAVQQWRAMKDADLVTLRIELEKRKFKSAPKELARDAAILVAERNQFDSAQLWLAGVEPCWDGEHRAETFLVDCFGAADTPYTRAVSLYMWTALAGRVIQPGCIAPMAPILKGVQGAGKSRGVKAMVPDDLFYAEIDLSKDDDTLARSLRGVLVGEINELRGLQSKDQESIKAWVSRTHEKWVPKFKEFATTFPRRCLLVGTTNRDDILADETGNRRWLPLQVGRVAVARVAELREQLWAEAAAMFRGVRRALDGARAAGEGYVQGKGGVAWQEAERLAGDEHEAFRRADPWEQAFAAWLDGCDGLDDGVHGSAEAARGSSHFTVPDVLTGAVGMPAKEMTTQAQMRAGAVLRALGFDKQRRRIDGVRDVYWTRVHPVLPG